MLNAGVLKFDAAGRIRNTTSLPTDFNGGTPTRDGLLAGSNGVPNADSFVAGIGYLAGGGLAATNATPVAWAGGIPLTAAGQVCVDATGAGVIAYYNNGLPYDASGKLVLAAPESPAGLSAFSMGFSDAEFH